MPSWLWLVYLMVHTMVLWLVYRMVHTMVYRTLVHISVVQRMVSWHNMLS